MSSNFVFRVVRTLFKGLPELKDPTESFAGKNVIVTGANTGLGLAAAIKFAQLGASRVIIGVRSLEKGNAAKTKIEEQSKDKNPSCKVEVWELDMLSYPSIKAFAARASDEIEELHVAMLNAGVIVNKFEKSSYGWETTLQVNTVSTAFLGLLLLPKLRGCKTDDYTPTLEIVGSGSHLTVSFDEEHRKASALMESYNNEAAVAQGIAGQPQYARSKMFLMYADEALAQLALNKTTGKPDVYVVTVCPGPCKSEITRNFDGFLINIGKRIIFAVARTTEQGSRTLVSGTLLGEKGHGQFWRDDEVNEKYTLLTGDDGEKLQKQVWSEILASLEKDNPEVKDIIQG